MCTGCVTSKSTWHSYGKKLNNFFMFLFNNPNEVN